MTEFEKMLSGEIYNGMDEDLIKMRDKATALTSRLDRTEDPAEREKIIRSLFGKCGKNPFITQGFHCDYGCNIEVGDNFYTNFDVVILDGGKVKIGDNCLIAPQVGIYTAYHPLDAETRRKGLEYVRPVTIGNDCWIGGGVIINPGVTLGDGVVVGSGSVVTKSFPSRVVIAGNPARIIRRLD